MHHHAIPIIKAFLAATEDAGNPHAQVRVIVMSNEFSACLVRFPTILDFAYVRAIFTVHPLMRCHLTRSLKGPTTAIHQARIRSVLGVPGDMNGQIVGGVEDRLTFLDQTFEGFLPLLVKPCRVFPEFGEVEELLATSLDQAFVGTNAHMPLDVGGEFSIGLERFTAVLYLTLVGTILAVRPLMLGEFP